MPLKIYYLDDEPDLLDMFVDLFSAHGREILTFSNPQSAIEHIKKNPPDIFFIDYRLPNCTGVEVAEKLDPSLPKVLITGEQRLELTYPFLSLIEKPYRPEQVEALLEKFCTEKKAA